MKLHLPTTLLSALLALVSVGNAAPTSFLAPGVQVSPTDGKLTDTSRFFDMGKGYYSWNEPYVNGVKTPERGLTGAKTLWEALPVGKKNYDFLGDLEPRVPASYKDSLNSGTFFSGAFRELKNDAYICWAYASANIIQYWQSEYGVFAKGSNATKLTHGYTYDKSNLSTLAGAQSLDIGMLYYDNFTNTGGSIDTGINWYFTNAAGAGGAFADYFDTQTSSPYVSQKLVYGGHTMDYLTTTLSGLLGIQLDGSIVEGHIAGLGVAYGNVASNGDVLGHALAIYGYELISVDSKQVLALHVADSDDDAYGLRTLYARLDNFDAQSQLYRGNQYVLYENKECTKQYAQTEGGACLDAFYGIRTSQTLIDMRADYDGDAKSRALVWSGGHEWNTKVYDEAEYLPSSKSPWTVYVAAGNTGYYASYFDSGRDVLFDDSASDTVVTLSEDVSVGSMRINNTSKDYSFSGSKTVTAASLSKEGSVAATFSETKLVVDGATTVSGGLLQFESSAAATLKDVNLSNGKMLLQRGEGNTASPTLTAGAVTLSGTSSLALADQSTATLDSLTVDAAPSDGTAAVTLAGASQLTVEGALDISRGTVALANTTAAASGNHLKAGAVTVNGTGTLALSGSSVATFDSLTVGAASNDGTAAVTLEGSSLLTVKEALNVSGGSLSMSGSNLSTPSLVVNKNDGSAACTITRPGSTVSLTRALLGSSDDGAYLCSSDASKPALLNSHTITVAEGAVFTVDDAMFNFSSIHGAGDGAYLNVSNSTIWVDVNGRHQDAVLDGGTMLTHSTEGDVVMLGRDANVYAVTSDMLESLTISGSELTLSFANTGDKSWRTYELPGYDFISLTFVDSSFDGLESLAITGGGQNSPVLEAYYVQPKARGAGQVSTLYFALGDIPMMAVPEPTTATLSLLALAALAARRRRR